MKFLLSIWNFVSILLLVLCGGAMGFLFLCLPVSKPEMPQDYLWLSVLNAVLFGGLLTAVVLSVTAPIAAVLSFIFKSWYRAIVAIAVSAAAMAMWKYFLECAL